VVELIEGRRGGSSASIVIKDEYAEETFATGSKDSTSLMKIVAGFLREEVSKKRSSVDNVERSIREGEDIGCRWGMPLRVIVSIVNIRPNEPEVRMLALYKSLSNLDACTVNIDTPVTTRVFEVTEESMSGSAVTTAQL
jgi:hypothetical protein